MTPDAELEAWREEWRAAAEPLPDWKGKIRRQKVKTTAGASLMCLCLALATIGEFKKPSAFMSGLATGLWFTAILLGSYTWWVRRGAWKPSAQTALAYAELSYKTALAKAKIIRLSFWLSLGAVALLAFAFGWDWKTFNVRDGIILAALTAEAIVLRHYGRGRKREIAEIKELVDNLQIDK